MGRSAMAEAILHSLNPDIRVSSCGTDTVSGYPATIDAQNAISERGLSLETHASQNDSLELLEDALVLCMTKKHRSILRTRYPSIQVHLLTEFGSGSCEEIIDPVGKGMDAHRETLDCLQYEITTLLTHLNTEEY